jgi:hypothetical protein
MSAEGLNTAGIKRRNMWLQVLWYILTCGFYSIYWFHETSKEMSRALGRNDEITLWTVLLLIPPVFFYSFYKHGELYENFSNKAVDRWIIFLLWLFFTPAVWFIVQRRLNDTAAKAL